MLKKYFLSGIMLLASSVSSVCLANDETVALPYVQSFDSEAVMSEFTVLDLNNDNATWEYAKFGETDYQYVRYRYSSQKADDWLLTPQFYFETEREYTLKFNTWISDTYYNKEYLEVKFGQGDDPSAYSKLLDETQITTGINDKKEYELKIKVTTAGLYRIGFHALSRASQYFLCLDDLSVTAGATSSSPGPVTSFTVIPAPKGELKATVSFTTPTVTTEGNPLGGIQKVELKRDAQLINTFNSPSMGQTLTFNDELTADGMVTYTAVAYGTDGSDGTPSSASAYVGKDEPGQVTSVSTIDNYNGDIVITWTAPSEVGANGGYVDTSDLKYTVYVVRNGIAFPQQRELQTFEYTDENIIYSKDEQELYNYGVSVTSGENEGNMKLGQGVLIGENYSLPFHESFKGGMSYYWWLDRKGENSFRRISESSDYTDISSDQDWGAVTWSPNESGDEAWLNSGKISLKAASNPALSFSAYCYNNIDAKIEVEVWDGENNHEVVSTVDMNTFNDGNGWHEFRADLSKFRQKEYVVLHFHITSNVAEIPFLLDNINVAENIECNLYAAISAPSRAIVGDEKTVTVTVGNNGRQDVADYQVLLYVNNKVAETKDLHDIAHNSETDVPFVYTVKISDGDVLSLYAEVICDNDEIDGDSESNVVEMKIGQNDLPAVNDLRADVSSSAMDFAWSAPATAGYQTTDTFDFYEAWLTSGFGRWTTFDGDHGLSYDLGYQYEFPHHGEPFAFIVFNPLEARINTLNNPQFEAYSGDQYLACFDADTELTPGGNNDWLISPELSGDAQTIKFYAKSISSTEFESFEVLTSTTGKGVSNFTNNVLTVSAAENDWNRYTAELPAGTKYFAIHVTSKDRFALLVDDITYQPKAPVITGYRLYCNGEMIGETPANQTTLSVTSLPSSNVEDYRLTVIYDEGESPLSNKCYDAAVAIEEIAADNAVNSSAEIFTIDGRRVATTRQGGIYLQRQADGTVRKITTK